MGSFCLSLSLKKSDMIKEFSRINILVNNTGITRDVRANIIASGFINTE